MTRTGLAIGGALLVLLGIGALTWPDAGGRESRTAELHGVERVEIESGSGSVAVRHVAGASAEVRQTRSTWVGDWFGGASESRYRVEDGRLVLDTDCGWNCQVDYVVTLPRPVPVTGGLDSGSLEVSGMASVDVEVGSGSVNVRGVDGPVAARTGSGPVELTDVGGPVDVETGSGSIDGRDLRAGEVRAHANAGAVRLELVDPRSVRVETGSGRIDLTVPDDRYRVDAESAAGRTAIGVETDDEARRVLELSTGSGRIEVGVGGGS